MIFADGYSNYCSQLNMKVFAALREDSHQGWVWLSDSSLPPRCVVRITNTLTRSSIYAEALQLDANYLAEYNKSPRCQIVNPDGSIVLSSWYRAGLGGLETGVDVQLKIEAKENWLGGFLACTNHPQTVVRLSAWLGGVGLVLGLIGLVLGVVSLRAS